MAALAKAKLKLILNVRLEDERHKYFALRIKGVPVPANHTPQFAPTPEPTIRFGVEAMTLALLNVLG